MHIHFVLFPQFGNPLSLSPKTPSQKNKNDNHIQTIKTETPKSEHTNHEQSTGISDPTSPAPLVCPL